MFSCSKVGHGGVPVVCLGHSVYEAITVQDTGQRIRCMVCFVHLSACAVSRAVDTVRVCVDQDSMVLIEEDPFFAFRYAISSALLYII